MPRSRHSIEFDGQGRILFQTADGQLCRFDRTNGIFDHIGSATVNSSAGGILAKGIGSPVGNEFFLGAGTSTGPAYVIKKVGFNSYIGDGGSGDTINTPLAVSGVENVPYNTTISAITMNLERPLATGEKVILQVYQNGSTTPTTYMTLDYSVDGAVSSKRVCLTLPKINNFSLGVIWKMTDASTTAPAVLPATVEID